ncbi:hypothetical protein SUDANB121_05633 [Nocardiopsis dassonvillei]|uniref:CPBP family intramembrane glutamic endopeptidase n=1 Tax=Nocardiopsis dassonvillei TaxID=2014 RepID=UPI003F54AB86
MSETPLTAVTPEPSRRGPAPEGGGPRWLRPPLVRLLLLSVLFLVVQMLASRVLLPLMHRPLPALAVGVGSAVLALLVYVAAVRLTERRRVTELPPRALLPGLAGGTLLGVLLFAAVIAVIAVFGEYRITGRGPADGVVALVGLMCTVAVMEELLFRGVLLRLLDELAGPWTALGVSAVLFGAMHMANPGATLWTGTAITVEAGLMLGAAYLLTRSLWLPIGLHLGWNFAASGIFGTAVSGVDHGGSVFTSTASGPYLLTGGGFGPEASIVAVVLCTVLTVLFLVRFRKKSREDG